MTDFGRLLADLNEAAIRYVVIGGIAVIRHGVVRATRDVDVVIPAGDFPRLAKLAAEWKATRPDGSPLANEDLRPDRSVHLKTPHGFLDVMAQSGIRLDFEQLEARAEIHRVDGTPAPICSFPDLVAMKRFAGRARDLLDLDELRTAHGDLPQDSGPQGRDAHG